MSKTMFDLCGLKCPLPIVQLATLIAEVPAETVVTVEADDPAFPLDVESWCQMTNHTLMTVDPIEDRFRAVIRKASKQ